MENMNRIINLMKDAISNPNKVILKHKEETGEKAIGCFPVYCPEELVHASGMLPIGIWGGKTELDLAKQYFPAFACSIMQSCLEFGLKGVYDNLAGVIIPGMCDTLICMGQNWKAAVPHVEYIDLVHPQNRKIDAGVKYLISEYKNVKSKLEKICGHKISEEAIHASIEVYNHHRKVMREFVDVAADYAYIVKPTIRSIVMKSSFFMKKEDHSKLVEELISELKKAKKEDFKGKKVLLTGILADSEDLLKVFEENNIAVVADDLAQETRQFRTDVPEGKDALERLARQWSNIEGCSLAYDPKKKRGSMIAETAKEKGADGVVFCMMKFCDPEEYDYPVVKADIEKAGFPTLYVEIDQQTDNDEQARTRIQTFAEMLVMA